jgi:PAS domain-containing protein
MNHTKFTPDFEGRNSLPLQEEADKIQQSEREYQSLFEISPYPAWLVDFTTLSIVAVNDAALALYGYNRKEFLALTLHNLIAP